MGLELETVYGPECSCDLDLLNSHLLSGKPYPILCGLTVPVAEHDLHFIQNVWGVGLDRLQGVTTMEELLGLKLITFERPKEASYPYYSDKSRRIINIVVTKQNVLFQTSSLPSPKELEKENGHFVLNLPYVCSWINFSLLGEFKKIRTWA